MPTDIDSLQIQINAQASKANDAIDRLVGKIDKLTTSLAKVDGSKITGLANGVQRLGTAMQTMNTIKTADFTRLATNLTKLGSVNVSALNSAASSMSHLTRAFNNLGTVSVNATAVGDLAKNIGKLGNKSVQTAVANIPQLATALNGLMSTLSKAPRVSQNVIDMANALANLTAQGSKVGSASNSIVKGLNRASTSATKANKSFKGLASAFGKFYANCFLMIRGLKGLWKSINSTADYLEAFNYFEVALNKVGGDWASQFEQYGYSSAEEYANSFKTRLNESLKGLSGVQISIDANGETGLLTDTGMKNLGLNIQEVTQYASQLASVTNSVGQTGEVTLATASAFTKLGADMSSLFNVDYKSVMNNLQSGLIGQSRALYKYGIDITNATLQTYAYELGVEKAVSEMTQAEKMQLRMIAILDQSKVAWGDQANTINSLSNSIRQFKNNISEAGQILGQLFVPIMSKVMPIVNGVTIAIKRLMVNIAGLMGIKLDLSEFGQGTNDIADDMDGLSDSLDGIAESAKKAKAGIRGFDELNVISTSSDSGNDASASVGGIDLTQQILDATAEYEAAWQEAYDRMQNRAEAFADKIEKALEPVKKIFEDFAVGDFFQAGQDVSNLVVSITDFFARAIDDVDWYGIGTKIGDFLAGIEWLDVFRATGNRMWQGLKAAFELAVGSFETAPLETAIIGLLASPAIVGFGSKIIEFIVNPFKNAWSVIKPILSTVSSFINPITLSIAALAIGLGVAYAKNEEVRESFANATQAVKEGFQPAIELITGTILPDLQAGWERLKEVLSPFTDFLNNTFVSIWQDMINPALTYIGKTVLPTLAESFANIWNNVLSPFGEFLMNVLEPAVQIVSDALSILWENVVVPLAESVGNILAKAFENLSAIFNKSIIPAVNGTIEKFKKLWDKVLNPIVDFLWEVLKPAFEQSFSSLKEQIKGINQAFGGIIDFVGGVFTRDWSKAWNGVVDAFGGIFSTITSIAKAPINLVIGLINGMISGVEKGINYVIEGIGDLSFEVPNWVPVIGGEKFGFDLQPVNFGKIPQLMDGGFVEPNLPNRYSILMAGENGIPEIVGTVGGRTAVVGGAEITGISDTIRATSNEEIALLRQQNALLQAILEKEFGISQNDIGKAAQSWARDYSRRTGREAYSF